MWTPFHYTLEVKTAKNKNKELAKKINESCPTNAQTNPMCHLMALLVAQNIFHVSKIKANVKNENRAIDKFKK